MSTPPSARPRSLANRLFFVRLTFIILIPLFLAVSMCSERSKTVATVSGFSFMRPTTWHYLTQTKVSATTSSVRFSASELEDALAAGEAAPLFALIKYPHPHVGVNPMIGVNVSRATGGESPVTLLEQSVGEVQQRTGNALELLQPITPTTVAGHPAARVVLHAAKTESAGPAPDKMTVVSIVTENLSLMVTGSGALSGNDTVDGALDEFLESLSVSAE